MTLRMTPEQYEAYERRRVTQIGKPTPAQKAEMAATWNGNVEPVRRLPAPESAVLRAVLEALRLHPRVAWAARINSGRFEVEGRRITASFKGCADILGQLKTGELLACECKSATGKTTGDQAAFLRLVADNGGIALVARSVTDVWRALGGSEAAA